MALALLVTGRVAAAAQAPEVSFVDRRGAFPLVHQQVAAAVLHDPNDAAVVGVAVRCLAEDVERVTGVKPPAIAGDRAVIVGTVERSALVAEVAATGRLDLTGLAGQWETYRMAVVENPLPRTHPGIRRALVIAGSDRRGAAFGVFDLSQAMGVSPWYWWADVSVARQASVFVAPTPVQGRSPSVKYRGIFINDEDWGLHVWAGRHLDPELKAIGPKTYARVFELLLRLKANFIWPAMHACSTTFYSLPENKRVADDYAIVIGSSHCEPLLLNNACTAEWDVKTMGDWNFVTNAARIFERLEARVAFAAGNENVYTVAFRGLHDQKARENLSMPDRIALLENVIAEQRRILGRHLPAPVEAVPQAFVPYNEVLEIYDNGLKLPDDITIVWADDNLGNIRHFNTPAERARSGRSGVYYHISYLGGTHSNYWLNSTSPAQIWKEMTRAHRTGADRLWVVNVGDIKPAEAGIDQFLQTAWDIGRWSPDNLGDFLPAVAARDFGPAFAGRVAGLLARYYALTSVRRPEHMGAFDIPAERNPEWKFFYNYWAEGDECQRQLAAHDALLADAEALRGQLPAEAHAAYFQLVLYPILGAAKKHAYDVGVVMAHEYARQGRRSAVGRLEAAMQARAAVDAATKFYNTELAAGKWNGMMRITTGFRKIEPLRFPERPAGPAVGVAIEGRRAPLEPAAVGSLPAFNRYTRRKYFVDLFNYGPDPVPWQAVADQPWIRLSEERGVLGADDRRLWVEVDFARLGSATEARGQIAVTGGGGQYTVEVVAHNAVLPVAPGDFIADNGVLAIEADHWAGNRPAGDRQWKVFAGLGRRGRAVGLVPLTDWRVEDLAQVPVQAPVLEYPIHVPAALSARVEVAIKQAFPLVDERVQRCALSIDDDAPVWVDFVMGANHGPSAPKTRGLWTRNAHSQINYGSVALALPAGRHTLKVWGTDPDVIVERIVIDLGGAAATYLGPRETRVLAP